jgi:hypothetical protein
MAATSAALDHNLSQAERRVLESFFSGRLPAGRVHAELCRAGGVSAAPPPLPDDTASIPVPSTGLVRRARDLIPA